MLTQLLKRKVEAMEKENIILSKSMELAVRIVNLYKYLREKSKEKVLPEQLLRSGTSIGANVREAMYGQSRNDFISKMSIALKEAAETEYWLELLKKTEYLTEEEYESIKTDVCEVSKILTSILKNSRK